MALCGPSNALGSLQKHVSADKTLQQDRAQRQGSSSNVFRTQYTNPRLEHEFSLFSSPTTAAANLEIAAARLHNQQQQHPGNVDASWASDFQRLHVSAGPLLQLPHHQQQQQWGGGGWHEEFLSHPAAAAGVYTAAPEHMQLDPQQQAMFPGTDASVGFPRYTPVFQNPHYSPPTTTATTTTTSIEEDLLTNEAFERAFESARAQLAEPITTVAPQPTVAPLPQAVVEEPPKREETNRDKDNDDLSRTAGNLLTSLQDNQSQKFRESNFLALMRRLRDREVKVEGDGLVEVSDDRGRRRSNGRAGVGVVVGGGEGWGDGDDGEHDWVGEREMFLEHSWWDL